MPVQQGLQHHQHIGIGDAGGRLHHHRLVELIDLPAGGLDLAQPVHDRNGEHVADALVDGVTRGVGHRRDPCQPCHRLLDEQVARPHCHTDSPCVRDHLHRRNAVAAKVEEGVVDTDPRQSEHLGVDAGQDLLDRAVRGAVMIGILISGRRQRAGVELAVGCQRQLLQHDDRGRDHVDRQPINQSGANPGWIGAAGDVPDEAQGGGAVFAGDHRGLFDAVEFGQSRLDFAKFDAVAADFDLFVGATQILQLAVVTPPHQVAGPVHPCRGCPGTAERTRHEPRSGQRGAAPVAGRQSGTGHVQFADHTEGYRLQPLVEHEQRSPRHRRADRHHS